MITAVALVALVALVGCGAFGAGSRTVTVVGDSLSVLGATEIESAIGSAGWRVEVDAFPGRTVETQMDALATAARANRRATIIELGTNDAHALADGETDAARERAQIAAALNQFPADRCLVWVNADANPTRPGQAGGAVVNDAIDAEAASRPNLHVADLDGLLAAHPDFLVADGVHLTDAGYAALGQLMADALEACR